LVSFAAVNDDGTLLETADPVNYRNADQACGLYEFTKR
jgi:hypothetical protein